jgi:D-3-phosphoglycerate dehydrogenase / 2-oxoglutarate reductase
MPRVLITPPEMLTKEGPPHRLLTQAGFEIAYPPQGVRLFSEDLLLTHLVGVDAVLAGMEPFSRRVLAASRLRAISRFGVGYDAIDVPAATEHGVVVAIAAGANQVSVAEHTLALLLAVFRTIVSRDRKVRSGQWERTNAPRLAGRTIGLVGLGRIGRAVATRAQSLGLRVIAYDPQADPAFASAYAIPLLSLDELLSSADIVSLHCPCTAATRHMVNADRISRMKPDAVLINTARGGLVDEPALIAALEAGKLFGAGLDTFEVEPLSADSPLCRLDNVVLTPHGAGVDQQAVRDISLLAAQSIASLYQGRWPEECVVNRELRDGWKW